MDTNEIHNGDSDDMTKMHIPAPLTQTHHRHMGPVLGILIVLLVTILGGIYLWGSSLRSLDETTNQMPPEEKPFDNKEPETPRAATDAEIYETVSPSDELSAIEADIESTNLDILDTDLSTIGHELSAAVKN